MKRLLLQVIPMPWRRTELPPAPKTPETFERVPESLLSADFAATFHNEPHPTLPNVRVPVLDGDPGMWIGEPPAGEDEAAPEW